VSHPHVQPRKPPLDHVQKIADHRPVGDVTIPIRRGSFGSARFRPAANNPSASSLLLQLLERQLQRPLPERLNRLDDQLILAPRLVHLHPPPRQQRQPVVRLEPQ
jgi:hypothetical protein